MSNFAEYYEVGPVPSGTSFVYRAVLTQQDGVTPIGNAMLQSMTLTLKDVVTGAIINSRDKQDVRNTNGVTIDESGATGELVWHASPADNPFVQIDPPPSQGTPERHVAVFQWTWQEDSIIQHGARKVFIDVESYENADKTSTGSGSSTYAGAVYSDTAGTIPVSDARVWVTSDSAGETLVAGPQQVGTEGQYSFKLDPDSYYVWVESSAFETYSAPITVT